MSDDLRLSSDILRHAKTRALRRQIGPEGLIGLLGLWIYCAESQPDGDLAGLTDADIEGLAEWAAGAGELVAALLTIGFLDGEPGHRRVHNWAERQPFLVARPRRIEAARTAAARRWSRGPHQAGTGPAESANGRVRTAQGGAVEPAAVDDSDATRMRPGCDSHTTRMRPAYGSHMPPPSPSPTLRGTVGSDTLLSTRRLVGDTRTCPSGADAPGARPQGLVDLWNEHAVPPIAKIRQITPTRRRLARAGLKQRPLAEWAQIFTKIAASDFCRGNGDRGWKATLDWVLKPGIAERVLEGEFDNPAPRLSARERRQADEAARLQAWLDRDRNADPEAPPARRRDRRSAEAAS